eukprot:ANDGO_03756.mRNA.1 hypothetical protein SAMD00019534_044690
MNQFAFLPITCVTSGVLGVLFLYLSLAVVRQRRLLGITLGDGMFQALKYGGIEKLDEGMKRYRPLVGAIRGHGNFSEWVPLSLILLGLGEASQAFSSASLSVLAMALIASRMLHSVFGLLVKMQSMQRTLGVVLNFAVIAVLSVALVYHSLASIIANGTHV